LTAGWSDVDNDDLVVGQQQVAAEPIRPAAMGSLL
jgi:hypothetical protein